MRFHVRRCVGHWHVLLDAAVMPPRYRTCDAALDAANALSRGGDPPSTRVSPPCPFAGGPPEDPSRVWNRFEDRWGGSQEELEFALEAFYRDVRGSFALAGTPPHVLDEVDDYVVNHYL